MLSAVILSVHGYPAMPLAGQQVHQRHVRSGPLVLRTAPLNSPTPTEDRDRTVSRRSKPSSRATFIGEQPNPWDPLQPQDVTSRHRIVSTLSRGIDYLFILSRILAPLSMKRSCMIHLGNDKSWRVALSQSSEPLLSDQSLQGHYSTSCCIPFPRGVPIA